jgi:hypothetical protein
VFGWSTSETAAALFARNTETRLHNYKLLGIDAIMVEKGDQQAWFDAANDGTWEPSYRQPAWTLFTRTTSTPRTITWNDPSLTVNQSQGTASITSNASGGKFVQISVGGVAVPFTALSSAVPLVSVPANVTGPIAISYSLPRHNLIVIFVAAGVLLLLAVAFTSLKRDKA